MAVKLFGIDVSEMNGSIDWAKVAKKVDYAIIRCGYGMDITSQDDANFTDNVKGCEKYNIPYGIYLYSYAKTKDAVQSEVDHTLRLLKKCGTNCKYGVWYDMEDSTTVGADLNAIGKLFCDKIKTAGYRCGIYASTSWFANYLTKLGDYDKWVAQYYSVCEYKGTVTMWQYTSTGKVSGITGNVDCNYCYTDKFASGSNGGSSSTDATTSKIKSYKVKVTATNGLNYRSGAGTSYALKGAYTYNTVLTITDKINNWGKTNKGWVCLDYTKPVGGFTDYRVRVTAVDGLNYRSAPGTGATKKGVYTCGTVLTITDEADGWGETAKGWVCLEYTIRV